MYTSYSLLGTQRFERSNTNYHAHCYDSATPQRSETSINSWASEPKPVQRNYTICCADPTLTSGAEYDWYAFSSLSSLSPSCPLLDCRSSAQ